MAVKQFEHYPHDKELPLKASRAAVLRELCYHVNVEEPRIRIGDNQMKPIKRELSQYLRTKHLRFVQHASLCHAVRVHMALCEMKQAATHQLACIQELLEATKEVMQDPFEVDDVARAAVFREIRKVEFQPSQLERMIQCHANMLKFRTELLKKLNPKPEPFHVESVRRAALCREIRKTEFHPMNLDRMMNCHEQLRNFVTELCIRVKPCPAVLIVPKLNQIAIFRTATLRSIRRATVHYLALQQACAKKTEVYKKELIAKATEHMGELLHQAKKQTDVSLLKQEMMEHVEESMDRSFNKRFVNMKLQHDMKDPKVQHAFASLRQ